MSKAITKKPEQAAGAAMQDALLQVVQNPNIDPERLEKFLDLQIKMEERQAEKELNKALADFQRECPIVTKNAQSHNASYAKLDHMVYIIKPILAKFGLSFSFTTLPIDERTTRLVTVIKHEGGGSLASEYDYPRVDSSGSKNESQAVKSALSYARRAGLETALGIVTAGEDDDALRSADTPASQAVIDTIRELIEVTGSDEPKLLKFLKVDSLTNLSEFEAKKAVHALKQKRGTK